MIWIYLVLIVVVIAFGLGVVVWNRRRSGPGSRTGSDTGRNGAWRWI